MNQNPRGITDIPNLRVRKIKRLYTRVDSTYEEREKFFDIPKLSHNRQMKGKMGE
jgi:hypothetical protein